MRHIRGGFTLLELMLVMVILVVAASLSLPAMESMMADGRLKAARDMVRARWADIRGMAMREGRPYKFSVMPQTGKYRIEPEDLNAPSDTDDPPMIFEGEIPPPITFADQSSSNATGAATAAASGGGYQCVVVYLADGTARDDVYQMFSQGGATVIGLRVRQLTGEVTMIDKVEDIPQ